MCITRCSFLPKYHARFVFNFRFPKEDGDEPKPIWVNLHCLSIIHGSARLFRCMLSLRTLDSIVQDLGNGNFTGSIAAR